MNLQKPQVTDQIAQLNARVTALEGANYNTNAPVAMAKFFDDSATATDAFEVYTHTYACATSQVIEEDTGQYVFVAPGLVDELTTTTPVLVCSPDLYI